jgi:hypothetical protein
VDTVFGDKHSAMQTLLLAGSWQSRLFIVCQRVSLATDMVDDGTKKPSFGGQNAKRHPKVPLKIF